MTENARTVANPKRLRNLSLEDLVAEVSTEGDVQPAGNAVKELDASMGRLGGRGQAQAGRILGIIGTVLLILSIIWVVVAIGLSVSGEFDSPVTYDDDGIYQG